MTRYATLAIAMTAAAALAAQEPAPQPVTPAFEVVVIKPNTSGSQSMSAGTRPGGAYMMVNGSMRMVFSNAYPAQSSEIINMPEWFTTDRYDITARIVGKPTREQEQELWRMLFAERMKLKVHYEMREQPTYDLVLARSDGRLGPNLKPAQIDCAARAQLAAKGSALAPLPPMPANGVPPCGMMSSGSAIRAGGTTMANLARSIAGAAGRIVVDKTGLTGGFDLTLEFAQQRGPDPPPEDRPSLFTALQEQLGLKLEPGRSPVQFAVIDYVEKPVVD